MISSHIFARESGFRCDPLLHITPLVPMFGRDIHTMLRGLRLDRYVFPLSAIRSSQGRRFPLRVTRPTEIASHAVGAHGASACVRQQRNGRLRSASSRYCWLATASTSFVYLLATFRSGYRGTKTAANRRKPSAAFNTGTLRFSYRGSEVPR